MKTGRLAYLCVCAVLAACGNRFTSGSAGPAFLPPPPPPLPAEHASVGLVSIAGGLGRLRADWRTGEADVSQLEFALFVSTNRALVLAATPIPVDVSVGSAIVENLPVGVEVFATLGVRAHPLDRFVASGPVLTASTTTPLYVDPNAPTGVGDGLTPATATSDLVLVLITAFVQGGGNVYVSGGDVQNTAFPLYTGVQLLGGFAPDFTLATRDPSVHRTRFLGIATQTMFRIETGTSGFAAMDGVELSGSFAVPSAIDVPQHSTEIRSVIASGMSRGFKVRGIQTGPVFDVTIAGSKVSGCELEGLSVDAAANIVIERSTFDVNGNEGADFNHLWAPSGQSVKLVARASVFTRNGTEGMDAHLGAPAGGGPVGGTFTIDVTDCDFELNELDGARIDIDYEATPAWSSTIVVLGSRTRANGAAGLHFDLDSTCTAIAHRLSASANSGDGFLVTSETAAGTATLSCSSLYGNLGFGARMSIGNFGLLAANCVFSGNALGGLESQVVRSSVHSSAFHLQPNPDIGAETIACSTHLASSAPAFVRAPLEYTTILAASGATLTLASPTTSGRGFPFEAADDGTPRAVTSIAGTILSIDPVIDAIRTPARGAFFDVGASSQEDWRLTAGSLAHGAGLAALGAPPVDAGVFAPALGGTPGVGDALRKALFRVADTVPHWTTVLAPSAPVRVRFAEGTPDPATVPAAMYGVSASGVVLGTIAFVDNGAVVVSPPLAGWHAGDRIEVHASLRSEQGDPLAFAAAIPLRLQ